MQRSHLVRSIIALNVVLSVATFGVLLSAAPAVDEVKAVDGAAILQEAWDVVHERFFDRDFNGVDWPAMREKYLALAEQAPSKADLSQIINAMLAELATSHMGHYTPEDREYYELLDIFGRRGGIGEEVGEMFGRGGPRYEGIGIVTKAIDGKTFISDVIDRLPADEAGLRLGDEIISADNEAFHPIKSFRGKSGQTVRMLVQRTNNGNSREEIEVQPAWIRPHRMFLDSIKNSARLIHRNDRSIAYVRIRSYASEDFQEALVELVTGDGPLARAEALVLDIRGGWGGANPVYLNLFNARVPAMTMTNRQGERISHDRQWRMPTVLLIDYGSRSGKEVIAHGFKHNKIGPLVGTRTAGAVVGGGPALLSDRSLLMVAVADVRVDGVRLEGVGVEPDIEVDFDLPYANGVDPQFERAVDEAVRLLPDK